MKSFSVTVILPSPLTFEDMSKSLLCTPIVYRLMVLSMFLFASRV